jgi:hypothetical protein
MRSLICMFLVGFPVFASASADVAVVHCLFAQVKGASQEPWKELIRDLPRKAEDLPAGQRFHRMTEFCNKERCAGACVLVTGTGSTSLNFRLVAANAVRFQSLSEECDFSGEDLQVTKDENVELAPGGDYQIAFETKYFNYKLKGYYFRADQLDKMPQVAEQFCSAL